MMRETDLKGMTRRSLLTTAGASAALMLLAEHSLFAAQSSRTTITRPENISVSFASLKQIDAGGIGHNLPQEAPEAFAGAVIDVNGY